MTVRIGSATFRARKDMYYNFLSSGVGQSRPTTVAPGQQPSHG
jgi:hypothetical protein